MCIEICMRGCASFHSNGKRVLCVGVDFACFVYIFVVATLTFIKQTQRSNLVATIIVKISKGQINELMVQR